MMLTLTGLSIPDIQLFRIFCIRQYLYIFKFLRLLCCKLYTDIYFDKHAEDYDCFTFLFM